MRVIYFCVLIVMFLLSIERASCQEKRLCFLVIGNAFYREEENLYPNVEGANSSAEHVYRLLNRYGDGKLILSSDDKKLSKTEILNSISATINKALDLHYESIIIYYCGHGQSDNLGTLYLVPGALSLKDKKLNQYNVIQNFISVKEIQQLYVETVQDQIFGGDDLSMTKTMAVIDYTRKEWSDAVTKSLQPGKYHQFQIADSVNTEENQHSKTFAENAPRIVLLADCCYKEFEHSSEEYYTNNGLLLNTLKDPEDEDGDDEPDAFSKWFLEKSGKELFYSAANGTRSLFDYLNGKIVFAAAKNTYAHLLPNSDSTSGHDKVAPISRRLGIFLNGKKEFSLYSLFESLLDPKFDAATASFFFEQGKNNRSIIVNQSTKIDADLKKRFSRPIYLKLQAKANPPQK